jgi:thiosulfate/3-mercaptopyruvate sulfurtransferase
MRSKGGEKMNKLMLFVLPAFILVASLFLGGHAFAWHDQPSPRTIGPIVDTDWLYQHSSEVIILDIRSAPDYGANHIPGSINEPFVTGFDPCTGPSSNWITGTDDCLWLQVPHASDLLITIGNLGISRDSSVVIVTAPNPDEPPFYGLANAARVAFTLIYAGVEKVAILDGGYTKWVAEGKDVTTVVPAVTPVSYQGHVNESLIVSREYVRRHLRKADIIDARDADVYFGITIEPFADKAGHIPTAKSLPAPWIWDVNTVTRDGTTYTHYTYKSKQTLRDMASGVTHEPWGYDGKDRWGEEIIVYCGVGGYASSWWFVLTQVLGYHDAKLYDGSAQEWVRYYDMVLYRWE